MKEIERSVLPNSHFSGVNETRFLERPGDFFVILLDDERRARQRQKNINFCHVRAKRRKTFPIDFDISTKVLFENGGYSLKVTRK